MAQILNSEPANRRMQGEMGTAGELKFRQEENPKSGVCKNEIMKLKLFTFL